MINGESNSAKRKRMWRKIQKDKVNGEWWRPLLFLQWTWHFNSAWSSLVEGDEQLERPNSQTTMELCHARVA